MATLAPLVVVCLLSSLSLAQSASEAASRDQTDQGSCESALGQSGEETESMKMSMLQRKTSVNENMTRGSCSTSDCYRYVAGKSCQCNGACRNYGNCCSNYEAKCVSPLSCTNWPSSHGSYEQRCNYGNSENDGYQYVYNKDRGKNSAECGRSATCFCCRRRAGYDDAGCSSGDCGRYLPAKACQCNDKCASFNNCCSNYHEVCSGGSGGDNFRTGYHQTAPEICDLIMASNFRPGSSGWCGGAIYFAVTPEDTVTKAIGENSHDGCMIEAKVRMGRIKHAPKYGANGAACDGYNADKAKREGYDSLIFNPGDGDELVVFNPDQVVSKHVMKYQERWRVPSLRRRRGTPINTRSYEMDMDPSLPV
eukprot:TRINITY_DN18522_c0_g2_i1.p1 TRINITY_DN18522_c0_g2~~TRINITY_DN18522_c0_g2_i1.p1  ORF type:complete len:385 (+),score=33.15 TRINITY_DN18522_c0_g2_i1:63-1157(+)